MNRSLYRAVLTITVVFALSGINHGVFEMLQGNTPTNGNYIAAIGPDHRMWVHGEEGAFTVVQNFLVTGVLAVLVSVVLFLWTLLGLKRRGGPLILFALFVFLFLLGGGVAQAPFFLIMCAFVTRIRSPLLWWRSRVNSSGSGRVASLWRPLVVAFVVLMLFALQAATTGFVPGVTDPNAVLTVTLFCVGLSLLVSPLIYISAIVDDARRLNTLADVGSA